MRANQSSDNTVPRLQSAGIMAVQHYINLVLNVLRTSVSTIAFPR